MNRGVTLVELLVALGIISILAGVGMANYFGSKNKKVLESGTLQIVAGLRETMERSKSQADDSQWGMHFENPLGSANDFYQIWKGVSYASGTIVSRAPLHESLQFTSPPANSSTDVIFSKATGLPQATSTIVIDSTSGGGTVTVNIDPSGRIDYTTN